VTAVAAEAPTPALADRDGPAHRAAGGPPWFVVVTAGVLLAWLTVDVLVGGPWTRLDHQVAGWSWSTGIRRGSFVRKLAIYVFTLPGHPAAIAGLVTPFVGVLAWVRRSWQPVLRVAVAAGLLVAVVMAFKYGVGRTAPNIDRVHFDGESFPSGHAALAVVIWGLLAWLAVDLGLPAWSRWGLRVLGYAAPVVTVAAMLLLDYHWLTDLLAGLAVGVLALRVIHGLFAGRLGDWGGAADQGRGDAGRHRADALAGLTDGRHG